jgi:DNA invertase Pin-like site-specific DNA recombinase
MRISAKGRNATVVIIGRRRWLMVTRLDRLARSTRDLLNTLAAITRKKAGFKSLGETWADTTTSHGRLMLTVLGGLAEFERDLIRARTGEGRERAVARGQRMGRPPKLTPHQRCEAIKRRDSGDESLTEIGRSYNVSAATISRLPACETRFHLRVQLIMSPGVQSLGFPGQCVTRPKCQRKTTHRL